MPFECPVRQLQARKEIFRTIRHGLAGCGESRDHPSGRSAVSTLSGRKTIAARGVLAGLQITKRLAWGAASDRERRDSHGGSVGIRRHVRCKTPAAVGVL